MVDPLAPILSAHEPATIWLSIAQAADRVGWSTKKIKRLIKAGHLPAIRLPLPKGKGHLRVRLGDLEALLARGVLR